MGRATLDLEPRRIVLDVPGTYALDVDTGATMRGARELDIEGARAEWRVGEGVLVVYA